MFHYSKPPQNYRCGVAYGENRTKHFYTHPIDDNWVLKMILGRIPCMECNYDVDFYRTVQMTIEAVQ